MTPEAILRQNSIILGSYALGRHYTTCPRCSAGRSTPENRKAKCLGVTIEDGDKVHFGCNNCNWTGPEKGSGAGNGNGGEGTPLVAYVYRDPAGAPLFRKVRNAPGREPRFWLQKPDGNGGWVKGTKGVDTSILYHADEAAKAIAGGSVILVAEGEKDVDRLRALGFAATCNAHGASETGQKPKWTKAHSEQLRGADIVVLNDNDPPGYAHADATCKLSLGVAKRVLRLDLKDAWPDIPKGGDVSDWLDQGHTREELAALIDTASDYEPRETDGAPPGSRSPGPNGSGSQADAEIAHLAALSSLAYEQARKMAAGKLNVRASALDRIVKAARGETAGGGAKQGQALDLADHEPWPEQVDGAQMLDDIAGEMTRYVIAPEHAIRATALWCVHTYLLDCFLISPRLAIRSPLHRCGKTTLLDIVSLLSRRALPSANVSAAAVFRVVEAHRPTLLIDEADTFLPGAEELRGIVNSGHRKGGKVIRTVGDDHEPRIFSTYSAVAIALIGKLPPTLHDRSAPVVDLKRRLRSEKVDSFRLDRTATLDDLAFKAARWAFDNMEQIQAADPKTPEGLFNRDADNWRPLLAIAEAAGGHWPEWAREAAALCCQVEGEEDGAQSEVLLGDIRAVFAEKYPDKATPEDWITSADLVGRLVGMESHPWAEMGKSRKPLTQNRLARMLKPLGVGPIKVGPEENRLQGYRRGQFADSFDRYLTPLSSLSNLTATHNLDISNTSDLFATGQAKTAVRFENSSKSSNHNEMTGCPVWKGGSGDNAHMCAQCGKPPDGREVFCAFPDEEVWLHPECQRAYVNGGGSRKGGEPPFTVLGPAPAGERCSLCGSGSPRPMRIKHGDQTDIWHPDCAERYFTATKGESPDD